MNEDLEQAAGRPVSRGTFEKLEQFAALLTAENKRQNLIARSTLNNLWKRHILDSAQLVRFEPSDGAAWVDVGSGAGLPGIVIACLIEGPVTLIEPRRLRADFLLRVVRELGLNAEVLCAKSEAATGKFDVITARAVAPLGRLLQLSAHLSTRNSLWLLPKGRNAHSELAEAQTAWHGRFHVEQSRTAGDSYIVVATGVEARVKP